MNIRIITFIWLLCLLPIKQMQAQSFQQLWKQVAEAEKNSLPATVIQQTEKIFRKGLKEKKSPQMLKAYVWKMQYRALVSSDSLYVDIPRLEEWCANTKNETDKALIHSLLAEIYSDYISSHFLELNKRMHLRDEWPKDLRLWSLNLFVEKIKQHVEQALSNRSVLLQTTTDQYIPLIEQGIDSRYYNHDLYHMLAKRNIDTLNFLCGFSILNDSDFLHMVSSIFEQMLEIYHQQNKGMPFLLTKLDYAKWKYQRLYNTSSADSACLCYEQTLNSLIKEADHSDIYIEAYIAQASHELNKKRYKEAVKCVDEGLRRYPNSQRKGELESIKKCATAAYLNVSSKSVVYPGSSARLQVIYANLKAFRLQLYQEDRFISEQHYSLKPTLDYNRADTILEYQAPTTPGIYQLKVLPEPFIGESIEEEELIVSRLKMISVPYPCGQVKLLSLDAQTGHSIPGVKIECYKYTSNEVQACFITDEKGECLLSKDHRYSYYTACIGTDDKLPNCSFYSNFRTNSHAVDKKQMLLFTDRTIYRPGQTVYVKGIAVHQDADSTQVLSRKQFTLKLFDANRKEITKRTLMTNDFGSFTTTFVLPSTCLNGTFSINTDYANCQFEVQSYKRPTFEVKFQPLKAVYKLNEKVKLKGIVQTYSGVKMNNQMVKYIVNQYKYNRPWGMSEKNFLISGEVKSDIDGNFIIPLELKSAKNHPASDQRAYYHYEVIATVTQSSGETQEGRYTLAAGYHSLLLRIECEDQLCKDDSVSFTYQAQNLQHQPIELDAECQLFRIQSSDMDDRKIADTPIFTATVRSQVPLRFDWGHLPSGRYRMRIVACDAQLQKVTEEKDVILFSRKDTRPPVSIPLWVDANHLQFDKEDPIRFAFGTSERDAFVFLYVFDKERCLDQRLYHLTDSIIHFEQKFQSEQPEKIQVLLFLVKNASSYQKVLNFEQKRVSEKLNIKWKVFRDQLRPGEHEEWKLIVRDSKEKPVDAEMAAWMYDASLDKLVEHPVRFSLIQPYNQWAYTVLTDYGSSVFFHYAQNSGYRPYCWEWDHLLKPNARLLYSSPFVYDMRVSNNGPVRKTMTLLGSRAVAKDRIEAEQALTQPIPELRKELLETAFYYPQLQTDEKGEIAFSFKVPETLTRWNFRGYVHTRDMQMGIIEQQITTSKELMLQTQLPRFVRENDITSLAAMLYNQSDMKQKGKVNMQLFNPLTNEVIHTADTSFTLCPGESMPVNFLYKIGEKLNFMGCRMWAESETFSDGEQQMLPVLSNRISVTETLPFSFNTPYIGKLSLKPLFNRQSVSATQRRLTVELTGNPVWYAIQALPSLAHPDQDNAVTWVTMCYTHALSAFLLKVRPEIRVFFEQGMQSQDTATQWSSRLYQNSDLKDLLLNESPWMLEAQNETEQMKQLATLFNPNYQTENYRQALGKLQQMQYADGSWPWFEGMQGDRYVTAYVIELILRMAQFTATPLAEEWQPMLRKAFDYLHTSMSREYAEIVKNGKKIREQEGLTDMQLRYLYLIATAKEKVPESSIEAYRFYESKVRDCLTSRSINKKSMAAVTLLCMGQRNEAMKFIASLKEHLTHSRELGMYFDFWEQSYHWGSSEMRVHVNAMEALQLAGGEDEVVDMMKHWLLKQKQTCKWNSRVTTVDAVYALLMHASTDPIDAGSLSVRIGKKEVSTEDASQGMSGLAYIKRSFEDPKVVKSTSLKVSKKGEGMSWGTVYASYEIPLSEARQHGNALQVDKKWYVERLVDGKPILQPVTASSFLEVGDKIISRLTLHVDRQMDFVQLKDQHAACIEPYSSISGYQWNGSVGYYMDVKDASTSYYFDHLNKGVYVLEHAYWVNREGTYETGLATFQCAYAPEYASHASSQTVRVKRLSTSR